MKFPLVHAIAAITIPIAALQAEPLKVGQSLPQVSVKTIEDKSVSLSEAIAGKPSVLVFYRGGWCPYCNVHLAALAKAEPDILAAGYSIIAISPDLPEKLAQTQGKEKVNYTLLSDSSMAAAKAFGISFKVDEALVTKYKNEYKIDLEAASGETHHLLPHPAVFIVDSSGTIRFAHVNEDYKTRLQPEAILKAVSAKP